MKTIYHCNKCGKAFVFRTDKKSGEVFRVSPEREYFKPSETGTPYLSDSGYYAVGIPDKDGISGHRIHTCK